MRSPINDRNGIQSPAQNRVADREDASGTVMPVWDGACIGYAMSSEAELKAVVDTSQATGIIFDPVYSGALISTVCVANLLSYLFTGNEARLLQ